MILLLLAVDCAKAAPTVPWDIGSIFIPVYIFKKMILLTL
jgi:hypothetical protein